MSSSQGSIGEESKKERSIVGPKSQRIQQLEERLKRLEEDYLSAPSSTNVTISSTHREEAPHPPEPLSSSTGIAPRTDACQRSGGAGMASGPGRQGAAVESLQRLMQRLDEVGGSDVD